MSLLVSFMLAIQAVPAAQPSVRIENAILRAVPEAGADGAGYAALTSVRADRLLGISCDCAEAVEIHRIVRANGEASMVTEAELPLPAGERVEVRPGSALHFMLTGMRAPTVPGERHVLTFRFAEAGTVRVPFTTVADSAAGWAQASLVPELRPLAFLVGSCWRATFPGTSQTDTHCYTAMHSGRHIRDRHIVEGAPSPYSGETIYRWDPEARQIRYDYYASDGGYSRGAAVQGAEGLSFPDEGYVGASGQRLMLRNAMSGIGPDGYDGRSEMQQDGAWREMWRMRFTRVGAAQP